MKERPILFSAPMVRAILAGTKTQTRREVKGIPWIPGCNPSFSQARAFSNAGQFRIAGSAEMTTGFRCRYGQPGDRLWVREAHRIGPGPRVPLLDGETAGTLASPHVTYDADGSMEPHAERWQGVFGKGRPSIHMPRWACRIVLEITDVRVQRLQDMSDADAAAEGIDYEPNGGELYRPWRGHDVWWEEPRRAFRDLWESINGSDSWTANPWVWALSFKRVPL